MVLNRFSEFIKHFFRRRKAALCPVRTRRWLGALVVLAVAVSARLASASVLATGSYSPADNPFTLNVNEGMPTDGNFVNPFEAVDHQTFFEGRHTDGTDPSDIADDTNINFDVTVGITSSGTLLISGESALRDLHLFIGDKGMVGSQERLGTGVVRITGFGSLYNNDPSILPAEVANIANFSSQSPRPTNVGFDAYVGRYGTGTLEISAGARAEIQDGVFVGDASGAIGNLLVDGFDRRWPDDH
jgi:hypothetical protein